VSVSSPTAVSSALIDRGDARDLLALLSGLPDPRTTGARVHPVGYVVAVTLVAFTSPAFAHLAGVAAWAVAAPSRVLLMLGARPDPWDGTVSPPSEATIRRVINGVDPDALAARLGHQGSTSASSRRTEYSNWSCHLPRRHWALRTVPSSVNPTFAAALTCA
jgi:DDE_Tnp_1-associated